MSRITVVLADDHHIVRKGLRTLLEAEGEFAVIGEEADGLKVVELVERLRPDLLLLDVQLPGLNGLEITRQIVQRALKTGSSSSPCTRTRPTSGKRFGMALMATSSKTPARPRWWKRFREVSAGRRYLSRALSSAR